MRSYVKSCLVLILICCTMTLSAQKLKTYKGKMPSIKDSKSMLVAFDYSDMSVGKFDKEDDYLDKKVAEKNEKEAGSGDKWKEVWVADRDARFEVKFLELLNKYVADIGVIASETAEDAKYKMLVKTTHTEPGFNVGVARKSAHVNFEIWMYEMGSDKPIAKAKLEKVQGGGAMGFDFDVAYRLQESYAKAGKVLGKKFSK